MNKACKFILILGTMVELSGIAVAAEDSAKVDILPATGISAQAKPTIVLETSIYEVACTVDDVTGFINGPQIKENGLMAGCIDLGAKQWCFDGHVLEVGEDGWFWDGHTDPPPSVKCLGNPKMLMEIGVRGSMTIGTPNYIQYFVKEADDVFRLKMFNQETGIKFDAVVRRVDRVDSQPFLSFDMSLEYSVIVGRKSVPGVLLDVGEPIVDSRRMTTNFGKTSGHYFGFWEKVSDRSILLIKMVGKKVD